MADVDDIEELIATRKLHGLTSEIYEESETDRIFLENGFSKLTKQGIVEYIDKDGNYIHFDLTIERFTCNCYLSIKELKAINLKCKELGWNE